MKMKNGSWAGGVPGILRIVIHEDLVILEIVIPEDLEIQGIDIQTDTLIDILIDTLIGIQIGMIEPRTKTKLSNTNHSTHFLIPKKLWITENSSKTGLNQTDHF